MPVARMQIAEIMMELSPDAASRRTAVGASIATRVARASA